jgi:hypothetical protein
LRVVVRAHTEQVTHFAFEVAGREREVREGGNPGIRFGDAHGELDHAGRGGEDVDDTELVAVVVAGHEREAVAGLFPDARQ